MSEQYFGYEPQPSRSRKLQAQPMRSSCTSKPVPESVDIFENPPEASPELKELVRQFRGTFNPLDSWDGVRVL